MTLPEHTSEYNPKGKPVLLTLLYIIKLISNYFKHLVKSYLAHYLQFKPPTIKISLLSPVQNINANSNNKTSTIADARHQEENPMRKKMSEGHSARGSQHMYK